MDLGALAMPESIEDAFHWSLQNRLSDGLPIVPPIPDRIQAMLSWVDLSSGLKLGAVPPRGEQATPEKIAINAVMAGCLPEHMPLLVAAVEALLDPDFNLDVLQASTQSWSPMIIVNGPIARQLDINSERNCFGQGWRANATIGRAIRLVLQNIGGFFPGAGDTAALGWPGKYTFCWAENEERSPWEPLHVERGFRREESTITLAAVTGFHNVHVGRPQSKDEVLSLLAFGMATLSTNLLEGGEPILAIGPDTLSILEREKPSKMEVKRFLHECARVPLPAISSEVAERLETGNRLGQDGLLGIAEKAEDVLVLVAGATGGRHSAFLPTWGRGSRAVTKKVSAPSAQA